MDARAGDRGLEEIASPGRDVMARQPFAFNLPGMIDRELFSSEHEAEGEGFAMLMSEGGLIARCVAEGA
jgi:hypothetical protein